jgi:hypothetical protein
MIIKDKKISFLGVFIKKICKMITFIDYQRLYKKSL